MVFTAFKIKREVDRSFELLSTWQMISKFVRTETKRHQEITTITLWDCGINLLKYMKWTGHDFFTKKNHWKITGIVSHRSGQTNATATAFEDDNDNEHEHI